MFARGPRVVVRLVRIAPSWSVCEGHNICVCGTLKCGHIIYIELTNRRVRRVFRGGGGGFRGRRSTGAGHAGGLWRPCVPAGDGAPPGSPGARRSSPLVNGPAAPGRSSAYRPSTPYPSLTSSLEPSPHDILQGDRPPPLGQSPGRGLLPGSDLPVGALVSTPRLQPPFHRLPYS